ncbi:hypothetical protein Pla110_06660 [Polystyrenella longa]|uniref:Uncharacterized protein n=1 Tax=Polystyrenella longa TaxID=2528007 RepID=A0A518CIB1_9PLAN|nr:hypothetical protein [Polystyrenella longa]QDU78962.1 hypothetical protein Pla110_06660 [Polystyrenella longa]
MQEIYVVITSVLIGAFLAEWTERQYSRNEYINKKRSQMNLKHQLGTAIQQCFTLPGNEPIVGFQVATIQGWLGAVQFLFELIDNDSVELIEGVAFKLDPTGKIEYQRSSNSIAFRLSPGIQLILDAKIARIKPIATGLILERNQLQLLLDGFPDIKIGLE